jgi:two-component system, OmpR family, sensor kinase
VSVARVGLRGRLAFSIAAIVIAAFAVTFYAVYKTTGSQLRSRIDRDLRGEGDALARALRQPSASPAAAAATARHFIDAQPFGPSARLLIVTVPGVGAVTNEPELVGLRGEPGERAVDARAELRQAKELRTAPNGYSDLELEDAGEVRLLTRKVRTPAGSATIRVGEPLQSAEQAQSEVAKTFLLAGAVTLALALIAAYLVAARTAAPLRRMARIAAAVDAGDLTHRIESAGPHDEVRLLAESFDHMLDRLEDAFSRQREFVSDASHEMRTPLTAVRGQLEVLARDPDPSPERVKEVELLALREIARMERLVDDLLTLARLDEGLKPAFGEVEVEAFLRELVEATDASDRRIEFSGGPPGQVRADPDQLTQVVRNLIRNAIDHSGSGGAVRVGAEAAAGTLRVFVDDDGGGIPAGERDRVFDRFHRIEASRDRRSGGSGLGLAIARSIVEVHGGRIWVDESPLGGARIAFELPGFRAAAAPLTSSPVD